MKENEGFFPIDEEFEVEELENAVDMVSAGYCTPEGYFSNSGASCDPSDNQVNISTPVRYG